MLGIILSFFAIGLMRVIQKVCSKKVSGMLTEKINFFHYGAYYQFISAIFSLIMLCITGLHGFNLPTFLCAFAAAVCFALDLFSGIEALKGATLSVCNMFGMGGLFIPCIVGIFLFDEPMSAMQWVGLVIFIISIYFLAKESKGTYKKFSLKTLIMLFISFFVNGAVTVVQKYFALLVPDGNVALYSFLTFGLNSLIMFTCMCICAITKKKKLDDSVAEAGAGQNAEPNEATENKLKRVVERLTKPLLVCGFLLAVAVFVINLLVTTLPQGFWELNAVYDASLLLDEADRAIDASTYSVEMKEKLHDRIEIERMTLLYIQLEYFNKETNNYDELRTINTYPKEKVLELCDRFEKNIEKFGFTFVNGDGTPQEIIENWRNRAIKAHRFWEERIYKLRNDFNQVKEFAIKD